MTPQPVPDDAPYDFYELNRQLDRVKSKVFLGEGAAFFGSLLCSLNFVWSTDIETAGTDGETLWWNPKDFLHNMDEQGRLATLKHELWHVARLHIVRQGSRDNGIWNIACDVRINRDLRKEGYKLDPPWWIQDMKEIPHEAEEEIYDWLKKNKPNCAAGNSGHHMVPGSSKNKQKILNAVVKAMTQAKMANGNKPGSIPGDIEKIVNKFLAPVVPWEAAFQGFFRDLLDEDYSWRRPNRRHDPGELYLPSRVEDEGRLEHLAYYWDVSGSITDKDEIRFNSEVKFIWDYFGPKKLTLVQFDTRITKIDIFNEGDEFNGVKIVGKGGTCLEPVRAHMMEHRPTAAIIFSDLECAPMQPLDRPIPTIWVAVRARGATVPFGKLIHIKG